ncbi:MAG: hypothetical protein AAF205_07600 [Pseudomonadota bacterium]
MLKSTSVALALMTGLLAGSASAQPAQPAQPSEAEVTAATRTFGMISSALRSETVPGGLKNALFACIYEKPLSEISARLTAEREKANIPVDDVNRQVALLGLLCGFTPPAGADGAPSQSPPQ